ncbi:UNVERIFIED_CONTAM: hypothetical protein RMT77_010358 [Armadillidium vulgare]
MKKFLSFKLLLILIIFLVTNEAFPKKDQKSRFKRANEMDSSGCPNRCEKKDHFGQCRKSIPCLLQSKDAFSIIVGGGCPRCKRADPGGRCRVVLSCVMGLS